MSESRFSRHVLNVVNVLQDEQDKTPNRVSNPVRGTFSAFFVRQQPPLLWRGGEEAKNHSSDKKPNNQIIKKPNQQ